MRSYSKPGFPQGAKAREKSLLLSNWRHDGNQLFVFVSNETNGIMDCLNWLVLARINSNTSGFFYVHMLLSVNFIWEMEYKSKFRFHEDAYISRHSIQCRGESWHGNRQVVAQFPPTIQALITLDGDLQSARRGSSHGPVHGKKLDPYYSGWT